VNSLFDRTQVFPTQASHIFKILFQPLLHLIAGNVVYQKNVVQCCGLSVDLQVMRLTVHRQVELRSLGLRHRSFRGHSKSHHNFR